MKKHVCFISISFSSLYFIITYFITTYFITTFITTFAQNAYCSSELHDLISHKKTYPIIYKGKEIPWKIQINKDNSEVNFVYKFPDHGKKIIQEIPCSLKLRGKQIQCISKNIPQKIIGHINNRYATICDENYKDVCELYFSELFPSKRTSAFPNNATPIKTITLSLSGIFNLNKEHIQGSPGSSNLLPTSHTNLFPFILSSPLQEEAGSCLYMASTGAAEIILNKKLNQANSKMDGDTDLSERFLMNISTETPDFAVNTFEKFNVVEGGMLNRDYRFTKGYYSRDENGNILRDVHSSLYGTSYNWIEEVPSDYKLKLVKIPYLKRKDIFVNGYGPWDIGVMNDDVVKNIKHYLAKYNSPILFIYNHYNYWHAVLIVGYDDSVYVGNCPFVYSSRKYFLEQNERSLVEKIDSALKRKDCKEYGVFYIRDSLLHASNDTYVYDRNAGSRGIGHYAEKIIKQSYDWARVLGNTAYMIYTDAPNNPIITPPIIPPAPSRIVIKASDFQVKFKISLSSRSSRLSRFNKKRLFTLYLSEIKPGVLKYVKSVKYDVHPSYRSAPTCFSSNKNSQFSCGNYIISKNGFKTRGAKITLTDDQVLTLDEGTQISW
ncbi:MAG: hypothetical protein HQK51_02055 [Oligoflexia bacterium]|nr:hypothetical protein [Oligoflexia bacterium]